MSSGSALTHSFSSLYFSKLQGTRVTDAANHFMGRLTDFLILNEEHPKIVAARIRQRGGKTIDLAWEYFTISEEDHEYEVSCRQQLPYVPTASVILLKRQILDKQIVDINDKKLVRVNDVRLAFLQSGSFPVAVDVGLTGLLRRIGVVELARSLFGMVDRAVPSRLILWQDIGVLSDHTHNIKLSVTAQKLHTLHASDLSDIIEELDIKTRAAVFEALDHEKAADVLEEMEDEAKVSLLEELTVESVSDVLDHMPHDEVADILDDLPEEKAEAILAEMDKDASHQIRELMDYPEHTAGSLMSTEFVAFGEDVTTQCVLRELRRLKPDPDSVYSIYVVDHDGRLVGVSTLRDIVIADPEQTLASYMDRKPIFILDQDDIGSMAEVLAKYSLLALPVVEKDLSLVGSIIIDDVVAEILKTTKVRI